MLENEFCFLLKVVRTLQAKWLRVPLRRGHIIGEARDHS